MIGILAASSKGVIADVTGETLSKNKNFVLSGKMATFVLSNERTKAISQRAKMHIFCVYERKKVAMGNRKKTDVDKRTVNQEIKQQQQN